MMMKHVLATAACMLALGGTALAAEGNGDPFPGPDAAVTTQVTPKPHYTMGSAAPFNYYNSGAPQSTTTYRAVSGGLANPFPFSAKGQVIATRPPSRPMPSAVAATPQNNHHG